MAIQYVAATGDTSGAQDRTRIQAALTAGGTVVLSGTYYISSGLTISGTNTSLVGTGLDTVLTCKTDDFAAVTVTGKEQRKVHIERLRVHKGLHALSIGSGTGDRVAFTRDVMVNDVITTSQAGAGVLLNEVAECQFRNLQVSYALYGVELIRSSSWNIFDGCRLGYCTSHGWYQHPGYTASPAYGGSSNRINNSQVMWNGGDGIRGIMTTTDRCGDHLPIRDCLILSNTGYGVNVNYSSVLITGCAIETNVAGAILVSVTDVSCGSLCVHQNYFEMNSEVAGLGAIQFVTSGTGMIVGPSIMYNYGSGRGPLLSSTGTNLKVPFATITRDHYYRYGGGTYWYEVGRTFNKAVIHIEDNSYIDIPGSGEGGTGYQHLIVPAS